jgi:integrase
MIGKRAKILAQAHVEDLLFFARHTRHPIRNQVIVLLSLKAGLRAAEIANLSWDMVVDPTGEIATSGLRVKFPTQRNREFLRRNREVERKNRGFEPV